MRRSARAFGATAILAALATATFAQDADPIEARQALMHNNGAAAGITGAILKGELEYEPRIGRAAIYAFGATAATFLDYFPEGSLDPERSRAAQAIWEDWDGFAATFGEYQEAVASAREAAGEEGPADAESFQAVIQPVMGTCRSCHEDYRLEEN